MMAVSHDDITELKRVFDERYVMQKACAEKQEEVNRKFSNDNTRITLLINQQKINNWLTLAIAGGIITLVIKSFFGG